MTEDNVIWVDENDNELGLISRRKAHTEGLWHRIVVVYVTKADGQILVQERMSGRLDHSSAGHVDPGEDYLTAAKRELKEEIGIDSELDEIGKTKSEDIEPEANKDLIRHIFKVYECQAEPGQLQEGEVKSVFWANPLGIYAEMKADPKNEKYTGGFKASLKFYINNKGLVE